jgi:type II secretory pathway pseudopilin PulG
MTSLSPRLLIARRRGLTLMELVVVMAILIAFAGIVVPLLPGLIGRSETSSRATNTGEITKWIQSYEASYSKYPNDWDALIDSSNAPISYVQGFTGATPPLQVTTISDANQVKALTGAGITRLQLMSQATALTTTTNATFNPYPSMNPATGTASPDKVADGLTVATGMSAVTLTLAGQAQLNLADNATTANSTGVYIVVGFGRRASIVGQGVEDAPVNFFDNFQLSPDTRYSRYGVVFQVNGTDRTGSSTLVDYTTAKLVRVFRFGSSLTTGDDAIQSYWGDVTTPGGS